MKSALFWEDPVVMYTSLFDGGGYVEVEDTNRM
jgi:hypothetical protein